MIENIAFDPVSEGVLGQEMADAADELACRINLGEFDDLDEAQVADLRMLTAQMAHWAAQARALEQRLGTFGARVATPSGRIAFCN